MTPRFLAAANGYQLGVVAAAVLGSAWLWPAGAVGIFAGGVLMALNFWALRTLLSKLLAKPEGRSAVILALLLATKFAAVIGLMALLVLVLGINAVALAVGLATLFLGVALGAVHCTLVAVPPHSLEA
jgi:hypothetical protein